VVVRRAARVDANHGEIVQALRAHGAYVQDSSRMGGGFPDLVCGYAGKTVLIEVKRPGGSIEKKLTEHQREWISRWCGGKVWLVSTPEEAIQALEESV